MRKLCLVHMSAEEVKALGADSKESKLAYVAVVQEVATAALNELSAARQLSDTGRRKLVKCRVTPISRNRHQRAKSSPFVQTPMGRGRKWSTRLIIKR